MVNMFIFIGGPRSLLELTQALNDEVFDFVD